MSPKSSKPKPTRFKKTKRAVLLAAGLLACGILSFPIWSPWVAKRAAAMAGVEIDSVQSLSWDRWRLEGIALKRPNLELAANSIELPSPTKLLFQHFSANPGDQVLLVEDWTLAAKASSDPAPSDAAIPTLDTLVELTRTSLDQLGSYLSEIRLTNGTLLANGIDTLRIAKFTLNSSSLQAELSYLPNEIAASLSIDFADDWTISSQVPKYDLSTQLTLKPEPGNLTLAGQITNKSNPFQIQSKWASDQTGFYPETASIEAKNFALDQSYPFWKDAPALFLDSVVSWQNQKLSYHISSSSEAPASSASQIDISGSGSLDLIEIESARVDLPWLNIKNDRAIQIDPHLQKPLGDAVLTAKIKLDELPFLKASGDLIARIRTSSASDGLPIVTADVEAASIAFFDTNIQNLSGEIESHGKVVTVKTINLSTAAGSRISGHGGIDLDTQVLSPSKLDITLKNESEFLRQLLPPIDWQTIAAKLDLEGPAANPSFSATLATESVKHPALQAVSVQAQARGQLSDLQATLSAKTGSQNLDLAFNSMRDESAIDIQLTELRISEPDREATLQLEAPSTIRIQASDSSTTITELILSGTNGLSIDLSDLFFSPEKLRLAASVQNLDPSIFNTWLESPLPRVDLRSLDAIADFGASNSQLKSSGSANWSIAESSSVDISWNAQTDTETPDALLVEDLKVEANGKEIFGATGIFPVSFTWIQSKFQTDIHKDAPLAFSLQSTPHPDFWKALSGVLPITIKKPRVVAKLSGSLAAPLGNFDLQLASLSWQDPSNPEREIELQELKAQLVADSSELSLRNLEAHAGRNLVKAEAHLPVKVGSLAQLFESSKQPDLKGLNALAKIEILDLDPIKAWVPAFLRQSGQARVELAWKAGELSANGTFKGLATRPLPPLGSLSDIAGDFQFQNGIWKTTTISGIAEKSPFTLVGQADLNSLENPIFDLRFSSKDFPLARDNGILFTGDVDMQLVSKDQLPPTLKGKLLLKKGLFLVEPDLLASSTKTVGLRPPYFAVEQAPFNEWGLDIEIRGDQFLRVSNSFFEGTLSADFDLEGNLGSPLLVGEAVTNSGRIFFPASSLNLKQGRAFITRDRPSEMQIEAVAEGRLFAYDVNLDVSGPIGEPELVITSNPALTQVDALLLLTTGAIPNAHGNLAQKSATSLGIFIGKGLFKKLTGGNSDTASKLDLEVGQDISLQGKKTIDATYQLRENLEIEGEYDKRDEFNANLKWTIFKR